MSFVQPFGRSRWVIATLIAIVIADVVAVVLDIDRSALFARMADGVRVTTAEVARSDDRQQSMGIAQVSLSVLCAIFFLRWFLLVHRNLDPLGARHRWSHGWALGAWFVPILNLWRPKQIANDIWEGSTLDSRPAPVLAAWWGAFLLGSIVGRVADRAAASANTPHELKTATQLFAASDGLDIVAAALAIWIVIAITRGQEERARP